MTDLERDLREAINAITEHGSIGGGIRPRVHD